MTETINKAYEEKLAAAKNREGCLAIVLMLVFLIPITLLRTMVFWLSWRWFAVPLGAPEIGFWHCGGLLVLFSVIVAVMKPSEKTDHSESNLLQAYGQIVMSVGMSAMLLLFAWLFHLMM